MQRDMAMSEGSVKRAEQRASDLADELKAVREVRWLAVFELEGIVLTQVIHTCADVRRSGLKFEDGCPLP